MNLVIREAVVKILLHSVLVAEVEIIVVNSALVGKSALNVGGVRSEEVVAALVAEHEVAAQMRHGDNARPVVLALGGANRVTL